MSTAAFTLVEDELNGDVPAVCPVTGDTGFAQVGVWFARSPAWSWLPLAALVVWASLRASPAPLASWWLLGALAVPALTSRAVTGQLWLAASVVDRLGALRTRRFRLTMLGLLLTWPCVGAWLLGYRAAALVLLAVVLGCYGVAVLLAVVGRALTVRGRPRPDGGVDLRDPHPAFVDAVELRRTGHRP